MEKETYSNLIEKIEKCKSEEELEAVSDLVDDMFLGRMLSKKAYKALGEALDDQLSYLVAEGII